MDSGLLIQGVVAGCIYALAGVSLNILYRPTYTFNFSQGSLVMLGAMLCAWLLSAIGMPWYMAALLATLAVVALSLVTYGVAIAPLVKRSGHGAGWIISTLAISLIVDDAVGKFFGPDPQQVKPPPPFSTQTHDIGGVQVSSYQVMVVVFTALIVASTGWFYARRTGKAIMAVAEDREAALLRGIDPGRLSMLSFAVGGLLAAITGILAAPTMYASVGLGPLLLIKGFEAVAIGGVGSNRGAVIGGCLLGVVEAISGALLSPGYQSATTFAIVLSVLLVRPQGLFGNTRMRTI
ncbi:MAG: branched-chain amino acid ABC transporter permease [Pseudomonadota bacterium]